MVFYIYVKFVDLKQMHLKNLDFIPQITVKFDCEECIFTDWNNGLCCVCSFLSEEDESFLKKKIITVSVFNGRRPVGNAYIDIACAWDRKGHEVCRVWTPLISQEADRTVVGYVKACVGISKCASRHECQNVDEMQQEQTIEQNMIVSTTLLNEWKRASLCLRVYRADGIPSVYNGLDLSVRAYFSGIKAETSRYRMKHNSVTWNEALVVTDVLLWLHPIAKVELLAKQDVVIGALRVNLGTLPEDIPVFGPNTMHMYSPEVAGTGCLYAGRVLLTFQVTELVEGVRSGLIIPPLEDEAVGKVQLLLVGEVRDAVVLDEEMSGQSLRLEVSLGEAGCNRPHGLASGDRSPSSACLYPVKNNRVSTSHTYLSCNQDDGTVYLKTEWADSLYRLHRTNHLENITKNVESFLDSLSAKVDRNKSDFNMILKIGLKKLCDDCHSYLAVHSNRLPIGNRLDRWRQTLRVDELILIKQEADALIVTSKPVPRECLRWARKTLERLKFLIEDPQHSLPDVLLSLWVGNSRFANFRIPARRVLHSDVSHERGTVCGVVSSLMLKGTNSGKTVAVVDVKLWLGRLAVWDSSHKWEHFALSPFWHEEFSLVAVVCQGYAMNSKVLQNSYVTVSLRQHSKRTQVHPGSRQPIWDETLWFHDIRFEDLPPTVVLELWTRSTSGNDSCLGYGLVKPAVGQLTDGSKTAGPSPKFSWINLMKGDKVTCQVYAVFHLQQVRQVLGDMSGTKTVVADIKAPEKQHYRLEVLLWGYRNVTSPDWRMLARRGIIIRFAGRDIKHTFLQPKILENFSSQDIRTLDVVLPQDKFPVLRITLKDMYTLFLSTFRQHTVENMEDYEVVLVSREQYESAIRGPFLFSIVPEPEPALAATAGGPTVETDTAVVEEQPKRATSFKQLCTKESVLCLPVRRFFSAVGRMRERKQQLTPDERQDDRDFTEIEARFDWWTKYFGTLAAMQEASGSLLPGTEEELFVQLKLQMIKIYFEELEKQPQFKGFFDCMRTFPLFREGHINGQFKGGLKLYRLPVEGLLMPDGSLPGTGYPSNEPVEIVVRLYVVRGIGLAIRDVTGASDPYLVVSTSSRDNLVNDRENYIPATLDPIFGRMFELELSLPDDYQLNITVMDRDIKWDDLIGTTTIDIENRYYSKFRATRGISKIYKEDGYRKWRDCDKPTAILAGFCERHNIPGPVYTTDNVILGSWDGEVGGEPDPIKKEELALSALNQWETLPYVGCQLVPEHVETRMLYDPNRVGETQGMLQLWVDIFDKTEELPPPVNIVPRYPDPYELRVTVWDTRDVLLRDYSILTGQRSSDIYVRGWLCSEKIVQETDIHYRSLTGEGNFNYRLIFRFDFWSAEGKISLPGKHVDDTNKQPHKPATKCPCVLIVEVWDNNHLYRDEEIGILKLNLMRLPQGANTSRSCTLETLGPKTRTSDLFKQRRTRGWWPFQAGSEEGPKLTGKIDMELELLTKEDAEKYPVGHGRSAPNPLDKPMRPETSFDWLRHPLKALYYSIWLEYRTKVLKMIIYAFITYIVFRFVLTLPDIITNTIAKKVTGC